MNLQVAPGVVFKLHRCFTGEQGRDLASRMLGKELL